jgi:hypothetical protein
MLSAAAVGALALWGSSQGWFDRPTYLTQTLIFLVFGTGLVYAYLYKATRPDLFLNLYLFTMVLKVVAYCVYNLIIIMQDKQAAVTNVGFFMATYFIFTAVEIAFLHRKISGENKP